MTQCTAKSKRSGQRCRGDAMVGKNVCYFHGGKSLSGPANPAYRTGRYSTVLPTRLLAKYEAGRTDSELLALKDELALVDARLGELLARVDSGESGGLWSRLRVLYTSLDAARVSRDAATMATLLQDLGALVRAGAADEETWSQVLPLVEARRKLAETESKRLSQMSLLLSVNEAMVLLSAVSDIVRRAAEAHIADAVVQRAFLAAIADGLRRLTNVEPRGRQELEG